MPGAGMEKQKKGWRSPCSALAGSGDLCPHSAVSDAKTVDGIPGQAPQASAGVNIAVATKGGNVDQAAMQKMFEGDACAGLARAGGYYGLSGPANGSIGGKADG